VPLVVRPPGGVAARRVPDLVELTDVHATVLEHAGAEPPARSRGRSLLSGPGRDVAVTESWSQSVRLTRADGAALVFRGLAWDNPAFDELLAWAPLEGPAFDRSPAGGDLATLRDALLAWRKTRHVEDRATGEPDPDLEQALRARGYWTP
jgi:hypothetical protein